MSSTPDDSALPPPVWLRYLLGWWTPLLAGAAAGIALRLVFSGAAGNPYNAMMGSFVVLAPILVGAVAVGVAELEKRRSWLYYFAAGSTANVLFVLGTLLVLIEGLICAVIIVPLFAVLGGVAGLIAGAACRLLLRPRRALYCAAALPLLLGAVEHRIPLPDAVDTVVSERVVAAPPERVWAELLHAAEIAPYEMESGLLYRIGVPVPLSAVTERRGGELVRHIRMGKGIRFDQVSVDWEPLRRVAWSYRFEPDSIPSRALDDHVRIGGRYFDLLATEYSLEPAGEGTRLTARMRYRVSTHFNWYARPLGRLLVRDFEQTALAFYARRAETPTRP